MVAAYDGLQVLAGPFDNLIRSRAITNKIPTAENLVVRTSRVRKYCLQCVEVRVDVTQDQETQGLCLMTQYRTKV